MATIRSSAASLGLRTLFNVGTVAGLSDSQLVDRFLTRNGEAAELAFSALVERHGAMVLRVCRRVLTDPNDAHDAFQATFLVLVRRASTIRERESLASWLHGVALRVATSARSASIQRAVRERGFARVEMSREGDAAEFHDLQTALHEEVNGLPARFRDPIVLCDLQEITHEQAAEQLGCPVGTVKSRLSRGRDQLRSRLIRRGLAPAAIIGIASEVQAGSIAWSAVSRSLVSSTAAAAMEFASGGPGLGLFRASAAYLAQGVLKMIRFQVWMRRTVVLGSIALGGMALGFGVLKGQEPNPVEVKAGTFKAADDDRQTSFSVCFIEMDGLKWREKVADRLEVLEQVDSQTVWTVPSNKVAEEIRSMAAVMTLSPKVTTFHRATAFIQAEETLNYVASVKPIHEGDGVAFFPKVQELKYGGKVDISGTIKPDGILTKAVVKDRHLMGIETSIIKAHPKNDPSHTINGTYQIPQLVKSEISGEWFVPTDGALVMSLGTHTETGRFGFSKIRERLVIIEPRLIDLSAMDEKAKKTDVLIKTDFAFPVGAKY